MLLLLRLPRRWGNLWKFSTAKLESRGKRMKKCVRNQSSGRPEMFTAGKIKKRKTAPRGGVKSKKDKRTVGQDDFYWVKAHRNNQMRHALAKTTFREKRRLSRSVAGTARREREQLCSMGKLDRERTVKTEFNERSRWVPEFVPSTVPFTVEGLLRAMVTGLIKPLYDINGKHACE